MQHISRQVVEALLADDGAQPSLTIYAPMHTTSSSPHISGNQIRLKNLVTKGIEELAASYGPDNKLAKEMAALLDKLHDDLEFWENQTPGLLICARQGNIQLFQLPVDTDEFVAVDDQFHLAPVLSMVSEDHPFYVLTVTQHDPKLFRGDMFGLRPSGIKLPASVHQALNIDEANQKSENQGSATGSSLNTGWFNGRGGARNPQEEDRMKFFRRIDRIITERDRLVLPMVMAGIDAETVEFRNISKYPKILEGTVSGGRADTNLRELHQRALRIVRHELVTPVHEAAIEEYQRLEGANPDRTARDPEAIETATEQGRVDKLLATLDSQSADTIRDSLHAVTKITFPDRENCRLINRLAMKVWRMSGTVINLTPQEMPHGATMVARLRY